MKCGIHNSTLPELNASRGTSDNISHGIINYSADYDMYSLRILSLNDHMYIAIEEALNTKVIPVICCLGVIGNLLNLIILTRKSIKTTMDRMERSSHSGLIALAVSDLLFCLAVLPMAFVDDQFSYSFISPSLIYNSYKVALINTFITSSTWLTVAMAFSRYLGICHPLKARQVIGMKFAKVSIVWVFVSSILFNLPRYWTHEVLCMETAHVEADHITHSSINYFSGHGWLKRNRSSFKGYMAAYFVLSIMGPLMILSYCNVYLIKALRKSMRMRKEFCRSSETHNRSSEAANTVTLTLAVIVLCNIIFMTPAEIFNFFDDVVIEQIKMTNLYNMVVAISNCLQAINFALNFVLYISINASFRRAAKGMLLCQSENDTIRNYESATALTHVKTTSMRSSVYVSNSTNGSGCLKGSYSSSKQGAPLMSTAAL